MHRLLALLVLLLALAAAPARAVTYPPAPEGPVLDQAGLIPDAQEAALDARLREYTQRTGRAIVVATVPTLEGETIEIYAVRLFEAWGIGGKESDQGLLLLVAPAERKVRIEVGYGLHQYVTDALSGRIIRNAITPRFREGDMAGGIEAGVGELIAQLDRTPEDARAIAEAAEAAQSQQGGPGEWIENVIVLIVMFAFLLRCLRVVVAAGGVARGPASTIRRSSCGARARSPATSPAGRAIRRAALGAAAVVLAVLAAAAPAAAAHRGRGDGAGIAQT
jgi:uncharacterized protein